MSLQPYIGFVGPSYTSPSKIAADDRTVNWYPEKVESGTGPAQYVLYPTPGYQVVSTGLGTPGRGGISINGPASSASFTGNAYFVSGGGVYRFPSTLLAIGISNLLGRSVSIVSNGDAGQQLLIASDATRYALNLNTNALTNEGTGYFVAFLDGYGISLDTARSEISVSALNDFSTWDPLDVAQRSDQPDPWQSLIVHHKEVWIFGSETTSVYYNSFGPNSAPTDFPFSPISSVFVPVGIYAARSACIVDGTLMWIGQSNAGAGIVYRANGYTPERISTHAVEFAFRNIGGLLYAEGSTYQENGHFFYEITAPSESEVLQDPTFVGGFKGATWVYDATEGLWHERGTYDGLDYGSLPTRGHFQLDSAQYTQSRTTGTVYLQSTNLSVGTDGVTGLRRLRRAPHINQAQVRIRYSHLRVLMEVGLGLATGQGSDPKIALRWSDDGGQTWGNTVTASVGRIGAYSTLVDFWQLGQGQDRVYEFIVSDPIPYRLIDAFLELSVGGS